MPAGIHWRCVADLRLAKSRHSASRQTYIITKRQKVVLQSIRPAIAARSSFNASRVTDACAVQRKELFTPIAPRRQRAETVLKSPFQLLHAAIQ